MRIMLIMTFITQVVLHPKLRKKPEMSEDSCSEGEVQTLCKTGQEVNCSLNSKSASTKGGM